MNISSSPEHLKHTKHSDGFPFNDSNMPTPKSPRSKSDHFPLNQHTSDYRHHQHSEKMVPKTRTAASPKGSDAKNTAITSATWHGEEKKISPSSTRKGTSKNHRSSSRRRGERNRLRRMTISVKIFFTKSSMNLLQQL